MIEIVNDIVSRFEMLTFEEPFWNDLELCLNCSVSDRKLQDV